MKVHCAQNVLAIVVVPMIGVVAAVLTGHAHGVELAVWWTVIGGAVSVSSWGWLRGRRRDQHEAPVEKPAPWLPRAVGPDEYAAQVINCADLGPGPTNLPTPRPGSDSTLDATRLVSGHSSECPALFRYPQSYAGTATAACLYASNADDLIANLNRVMPG